MSYPYTYKYQRNNMWDTGVDQSQNQWTKGEQPVPVSTSAQLWSASLAALPIFTIARLGKKKFKSGKYGWDYMISAARLAEEYSPGHIFRTFQISHMLSPLESPSRIARYYTPELITKIRNDAVGNAWLENLSREVGDKNFISKIADSGFRFENGKIISGLAEGEVLLEHANVVRSPTGMRPVLQEARARSVAGGPLSNLNKVFKANIPFLQISPTGEIISSAEAHTIIGGKNRLQQINRLFSGYGTSLVERMNQLARAPAELPIVSGLFERIKRIPGFKKFHLGVEPSSGLKTLGGLTAKLGLLGTAAYYAYQEVDYRVRKASIFEDTILDEGITAGAATAWTRGQVKISEAAAATGLHSYREKQEEIAPGSTELSKLMAFPIMGALGGLGVGYAQRVYRQSKFQMAGLGIAEASLASEAEDEFFRAALKGRPIKSEVLGVLNKETINMLNEATNKRLAGIEGKVAQWISRKGERRTFGGAILRAFGEVGPGRLKWMAGLLAGTALVLPFIPGALVPSERPEKLEALYSGQERVAIKKGRWWEFGRSPYEGARIDRFQEHWYPRMLARGKEKAIWGEDEPGPLRRWYIENFTYELEQKHYWDRPYPISGSALEDVPFLGPILSSTLGRMFKPPRFMHVEEWMRAGREGSEYKTMPSKYQEVTLPGELDKGEPISPYGVKGVVGEEAYRMQEMVGLPGFSMASLKEKMTGTQDLFAQEAQLESARRMYGAEREYWDKELGGGLGTTELIRRLYPHRRRQIELYNPIPNTMPNWLPGPGDRSPDFRHGDPYVKIAEGETRLPGEGYAALHPELRGVAPEDYPLIHKFKILADVAPYSESYGQHLGIIRSMARSGQLSPEEMREYHRTINEISQRKTKKVFHEYQYKDKSRSPMQRVLADANEREKGPENNRSWFAETIGSYWETIAHKADTPAEFLTPVSPASKLLHMRTAIEDYEKTQVWGTESAFWEHPLRDFLKPAVQSAVHAAGLDYIPGDVSDRRELEEYFDILKYVKHTRLKRAAESEKDFSFAQEMESKRRETLFGVNPYTFNFTHIMRALPRRERDYFNAFSDADMAERAEIYKMIPENEKALYLARWKMKDADDIQMAVKKGLLDEEQIAKAEVVVSALYEDKATEGMPKDKKLWAEYLATRMSNESYPDWYRRTKLLEQKLGGRQLPGPDWVGWHPAVDLEDIKLKIVKDAGENMYEYDLWPDRLRAIARRPQIAEAAQALEGKMDPEMIRSRINDILSAHNIDAAQVHLMQTGASESTINLQVDEDRSKSDRDLIRKRGIN